MKKYLVIKIKLTALNNFSLIGLVADYAKNGEDIAIESMPMVFQSLFSGDIFQYQKFKRTDFDLFKLTLAL